MLNQEASYCATYRSKEIKYQYNVQKEDLQYKRDKKLLGRYPSGYMTVEEYEKKSEYKDKSNMEFDIPKIDRQEDFKYIPQPLYRIVKYNDPPGKTELSLGRRLFFKKQINAQGIVSPDYSIMVYPAIYYYQDTGSVAADVFVIPLKGNESNLTKILKANVAQRDPEPILSTDKAIDNYAAFRTLTPVDFNNDGSKLLVKEKLGSSEDGIWETNIYIYDFTKKTRYDLSTIREAIEYFWNEYMHLNLEAKRWDIIPLGFDAEAPDRVIVQAYAYTGEKPVFLGTWSIDTKAERSQLVSFKRDFSPSISSNGFKLIKDGVKTYETVQIEEKMQKKQDKVKLKQLKAENKKEIKVIKEDYKYELKDLKSEYKDDYRDNKKLESLKGSSETKELEEAYNKYLQDQLAKDIKKTEKNISKQKTKINKIENKIQKITNEANQLKDSAFGSNNNENATNNDTENNEAPELKTPAAETENQK